MGTYWSLPLIIFAVILQATVLAQIRIFGGQPDLVFLMMLSWAINGRLEQNVTWAFVGGIAQDLMSAAPTGASVLGMLLLAFGIEQIRQQVYRIGFMLIIALVIVGTLLQKIVFMVVLAFNGFAVYPLENLTYVILPTIAYNLLFIGPIYWLIRRIQRRSTSKQRALTL
jgi:rod shape-determining protein MreD